MDADCYLCGKLLVNYPPNSIGSFDEPPACLACDDDAFLGSLPIDRPLERLVLRLLWHRARRRSIRAPGPDPWIWSRWTVELGPLSLTTDTAIILSAKVEWRGRTIADFRTRDRRDLGFRPLARAAFWLHDALEGERDRKICQDSLTWYGRG